MTEDLTTPLTDLHLSLGARMVPFAGYSMPVQFEGVLAEHNWTRDSAGLFDVSHMGQVWIDGPTVLQITGIGPWKAVPLESPGSD